MPVDLPRFGAATPGLSQWWQESRVALAFLTRLPVKRDLLGVEAQLALTLRPLLSA